jgi:hypothetical protein
MELIPDTFSPDYKNPCWTDTNGTFRYSSTANPPQRRTAAVRLDLQTALASPVSAAALQASFRPFRPGVHARCLPAFYVTGLFHAGGNTFGDRLRLHPDVLVVRGAAPCSERMPQRQMGERRDGARNGPPPFAPAPPATHRRTIAAAASSGGAWLWNLAWVERA